MKQKKIAENFLERKPVRAGEFRWTTDGDGKVTLEIDNKGIMNRICQKLFKKPPVSFIHLDEMGSFLWPLLDGEKNLIELGEAVKTEFGDGAEPLYERLVKYVQILESYHFIKWN
ncbi:MAG: PqqD family protein [Clostridia bacterium]|nr:PqqD family protein [Clostridia bacterium]